MPVRQVFVWNESGLGKQEGDDAVTSQAINADLNGNRRFFVQFLVALQI
ncbi:hypothetical protein K788_00025470 (plasmid) [Paraburkholderia caribensis MBA4]|uniref:Uncharacterized protein n=1 Tax=Paraburkholderia caribensis MBA4 TaxID=1323664 RepID=A0A0P0RLK1_9BURK|nr:hypothetical protein K788_00025470 [Paraburkholderia caribensis MBA4]